jgi:hypothetical protein
MDVPILTAVIGVGGSLMGTIIGGCLTVYSNFFLNRRRERAEFRIGCRLISGELRENHVVVITLLQTRRWWDFDQLEPGMKPGKIIAMSLPLIYPQKFGMMCSRRYRRFTRPVWSGLPPVWITLKRSMMRGFEC